MFTNKQGTLIMCKNKPANYWRALKKPALIILILVVIFIGGYLLKLTINISPSMKYGIYVAQAGTIQRGDIVAICLNKQWSNIGLKNNYLPAGDKCEGTVPLIKQVIAVPGDTVILTENNIVVNGHVYHDKTMHIDGKGRAMMIYPRGSYQHIIGYFLIGNNAPNSWDSRYWGIIPPSQVLYKLNPIFTV